MASAWSFSNLKMFTWEGVAISPAPLPSGYCALTQEGYAISLPTVAGWNNLPLTVGIGPTGYFILNIGQDPGLGNFNASIPFGLVGIAQPSAPLDVSKLAAAKFIGFESDVNSPVGNVAVAFGAIAGPVSATGASITGGAFPNGDITQTPAANITISLGVQDPHSNGLFPAMTVTVPDTYHACLFQPYGGTDPSGNPTCIFHGAAVAGEADGKIALFVGNGCPATQVFIGMQSGLAVDANADSQNYAIRIIYSAAGAPAGPVTAVRCRLRCK